MNKKVLLPSGAELEITVSPFAVSKALYMAIAEEAKNLKMDANTELDTNFLKDMLLTAVSSKKIEIALDDCLKRVTYNGLKIEKDTFEPVEARQDYFEVMYHVARENVYPFTKNLCARYRDWETKKR